MYLILSFKTDNYLKQTMLADIKIKLREPLEEPISRFWRVGLQKYSL